MLVKFIFIPPNYEIIIAIMPSLLIEKLKFTCILIHNHVMMQLVRQLEIAFDFKKGT